MPGWSTEVASYLVRIIADQGKGVDQLRLQRLVYIAHGRCLVETGGPLTGDRPEAWKYGPVYRRLANALREFGETDIPQRWMKVFPDYSGLDRKERTILAEVVHVLRELPLSALSAITRGENSPWQHVFADGKGLNSDIPHSIIEDQFRTLLWPPQESDGE